MAHVQVRSMPRRGGLLVWVAFIAIASEALSAEQVFLDDFERRDIAWGENIGPGWLHNQYTPAPPPVFNRFSLVGGKLRGGYDANSWLVATNFVVGSNYAVSVDIQYTNLTVGVPFTDSLNTLFGNRQYGPTPPNDQDNKYLEAVFIAPYEVGPPPRGRVLMRIQDPVVHLFDNEGTGPTNFVVNEWYRLTLQRSNNFARTTLTGTNVNVDSGWRNMGASAPPVNPTNGYAGVMMKALNKGYMNNFSVTTGNEPVPPSAFFSYLSTNDVSLYVPFEGTATATIAKGNPTPMVNGMLEYGAGKYGQGYLAGRDNLTGDGDELLYAVTNNIDYSCGTIAMWVKPLNWADVDQNWRVFFSAVEQPGSPAILRLYKYFQNVPIFWHAIQSYSYSVTYAIRQSSPVWASNQWTHLAASWVGPVMRLYVDGEQAGSAYAVAPNILRNFGTWMYVGGSAVVSNTTPDTVIDEFYVFNRPLTQREISTLWQLGTNAFAESATPGLEIGTVAGYQPSSRRLEVRITLNGRRADQVTNMSYQVNVQTSTGGATSISPVTGAFVMPNLTETFDVELASGSYRTYTEIMTNGYVVGSSASGFDVPATDEWLGNTTGVPSGPTPPSPWTALATNGQVVSCWGATIAYQDSLFPTQMCARGTDLLARPIRLVLTTNGVAHTALTGATFSWTNVTALAAAFCASGMLGDVSISVSGLLEFDGFLWTTLSIPAQGGIAIQELKLEIPMVTSAATFQQGALYNGEFPASGRATTWSCPIKGQPYLWLGNQEVGLQWCTGDNYCYANGGNQGRQAELVCGPVETVFTVRLVDIAAGLPLDSPLTYTFGLQTTPVKPYPANWRSYDIGMGGWWRPAAARGRAAVTVWHPWWQGWNTQNAVTRSQGYLFGYPAPDPLTCASNVAVFVADGERPLLYWDMHSIWRGAPAYAGWRSEWGPNNPGPAHFDTASGKDSDNGYAYRTVPTFRDWAIWRYRTSMADNTYLTNVAGFYNDVAQGFWGPEPHVDSNGLVTARHEVLGVRELQKRMYVSMADWPDKVILNHQSGDSHMSQLAFAHIYLNGEQYRPSAASYGYQQIMNFDRGVAELLGHKWGIPLMFLPELPNGITASNVFTSAKGLAAGEHLLGLLLMHDAIPYGDNVHPLPLARVAAVKELFGWDEQVEYIGYWKTSPAYLTKTADQSPVEVTVYRRPDAVVSNYVLFVVMNNSDSPATVTLTPDWGALAVFPAPTGLVDAVAAVGIPDAPVDFALLTRSSQIAFIEPRVYGPLITLPEVAGSYTFSVSNRNFRILASDQHFGEDPTSGGVPQRWLVRFYPGTTNWDVAAMSDTDGDGMAAWGEYGADTDPTARGSLLRVTDIQPVGSNRVEVYWSSRTTRTYTVEMTTNLSSGWPLSPRTSGVPGAVTGTNRYEDVSPTDRKAIYRIRVE